MLRNTMRTPFLAALLGLSLVSCTTGEISGGGDDDMPGGPTCGNGVVDQGEQCDGTVGCAADCTLLPIPRVDITVDKPTVMTELASTTMLTVTVKGSGGFSGPVNLTAEALDSTTNAPLAGWTITLDSQTVTLNDSQAVVIATLTVPSENKGLAANVKITGQSTATEGTNSATTAVTAQNQVSLAITMNNGNCVYPGGAGSTTRITEGTKVRFVNKGTGPLIIHSDGGAYGVPHQDTNTTTAIDSAYERTISAGSADGKTFGWYCHSPGVDQNTKILVVAPGA